MTVLLLLALVAAIFLRAAYRTVFGRIHREGLSLLIVRWLLGKPWHGEPLTDAGWSREGKRALTKTGHASRWAHRPQRERVAWRFGITAAVLAWGYGMIWDRGITLLAMELGAVTAVIGAGWLAWRSIRLRKHRKSRLYPMHNALAAQPFMRKGLPSKPEAYLAIDRAPLVRWLEIDLPDEWSADSNQIKAICTTATARLPWAAPPKPKPKFTGAKPKLRLEAIEPPPKKVGLADVMPAIQAAKHHELVLGRGEENSLVKVSLAMESPHLGMSVSSGGGKSWTARLIGSQAAYRGATLLILDFPKLVSLRALRGLPNVAYCDSAALVHSACMWLARELEERAAEVKDNTDDDEVFHGRLDRLLIIAEESNALFNRLRVYWNDVRQSGDPKKSPAIDGLELALFMGRQLNVNVVQIGQMLSVRATGSGEARENLGIRILGRATENNWKMMVPEHPYPGKTTRPGRVHVVTDNCVETQIAGAAPREARALAVAGVVTPCPRNMPGRPGVLQPPRRPVLEYANGADQGVVLDVEPLVLDGVSDAVSLPQAVELGISQRKLGALNRASTRPGFPEPVGRRGNAKLYDPDALARWDARRQ